MGTTICSRCKAWINDREWRCRSCGKLLPGLFGQRRWLDTVFSRSRSQARTLLVVLIVCFLLELLVSQFSPNEGERPHFSLDPTGLGMLRSGAVYAMGRHGGPNEVMRSEPWRLVTAMLLHGGVFHILMNGLSLLSLGMFVEALFGPAMFWVVFTLTGVVGNLVVVYFSHPGIAIGASGGIFDRAARRHVREGAATPAAAVAAHQRGDQRHAGRQHGRARRRLRVGLRPGLAAADDARAVGARAGRRAFRRARLPRAAGRLRRLRDGVGRERLTPALSAARRAAGSARRRASAR
jgi:hypothetical protein